MTEQDPRFNIQLARRFAWLLRKDLREKFGDIDSPGFEAWWQVKGRQEYPAWADHMDPAYAQALFEPAGEIQIAGVPLVVPKAVQALAKHRPDATRQHSSNGQLNAERFTAWALLLGLAEHRLLAHVPRSLVAALDQPVRPAGAKLEPAPQLPTPTLLMYLLWLLLDEPTQRVRDWRSASGRQAFLRWFMGAVGPLGLAPLVAGRWWAWLPSAAAEKALGLDSQLLEQLASKGRAAAQQPTAKPSSAQATPPESKPWGVNLYGFAYGELGIGEDLRMAVACCEAANIPHHVVNVDAGNIRQADTLLQGKAVELHSSEPAPYRINIFCLPAFDTASRIYMQKGAEVFKGHHNIGWWPWELNVFPKAWQPHAFDLVDEVWASSTFLEDMYQRATTKPVKLVPLAVSVDRLKKYPRKHFGLPAKTFLFLFIFDFNSSVERKNPMATLEAFKLAFLPTDNSVGLVFKTMNTNSEDPKWKAFIQACDDDNRIYVITETYSRPEVLGLMESCDAYVSLHRAEGYGRTMAEALLLGKTVLATNYSGNVDFCECENIHLISGNVDALDADEYPFVAVEDRAVWMNVNKYDAAKAMNLLLEKKETKHGVPPGPMFSVAGRSHVVNEILLQK